VGEKKLHEFGEVFLREIRNFLETNPRQIFADESFSAPAAPVRSRLNDTARETLHFLRQGKSVEQIAIIRGLKESTIYGHLEDAVLAGERIEVETVLDAASRRDIEAAFERHGFGNLVGAVESLGGRYSSGQLRFFRLAAQRGLVRA
jgi:ATP-dependent DNA helicase RecQ